MVAAENEASAAESNARYFYLVLVNFCLTNWMPRVIYGYARSARRPQHSLLLPEVQAVHAVALAPTISREPALRIYFCRGGACPARSSNLPMWGRNSLRPFFALIF